MRGIHLHRPPHPVSLLDLHFPELELLSLNLSPLDSLAIELTEFPNSFKPNFVVHGQRLLTTTHGVN